MIAWALTNWKLLVIAALAVTIGLLTVSLSIQKAHTATAKLETATLRQAYAEASANATREAMQTSSVLAARGNALATQLITTRRERDQARQALTGRIPDVAQTVPASCTFGPEFLGLLSDSYYGVRANASANATDPGRVAGQPGQAAASGASVMELLTWLEGMGAYVLDLEDMSAARLRLLEAWETGMEAEMVGYNAGVM